MEKSGPSLLTRAVAVVVLLIAAWILLRIVIGIVAGVAGVLVILIAAVAAIWAWRTLRA